MTLPEFVTCITRRHVLVGELRKHAWWGRYHHFLLKRPEWKSFLMIFKLEKALCQRFTVAPIHAISQILNTHTDGEFYRPG